MNRNTAQDTGERGSVAVVTLVLSTMFFAMAALVADGGRLMTARRDAEDAAQSAARAASQAFDASEFAINRGVEIPEYDANVRAQRIALATGTEVSLFINGAQVSSVATKKVSLPLLSVFGISEKTVTGRGSAIAQPGVEKPE
jgi:Flp pilus assembly protein TadG